MRAEVERHVRKQRVGRVGGGKGNLTRLVSMIFASLILNLALPDQGAATAQPEKPRIATPPRIMPEFDALIKAAVSSGDSATVEALVRYAKQVYPAHASEIEKLSGAFIAGFNRANAEGEEEQQAKVIQAEVSPEWSGQVEVGASRSTGTTNNLSLFAAVGLRKEGVAMRHDVAARAELQETNSIRSAERLSASWRPRKNFSDQTYGYGFTEYDRDPFLDFKHRITSALGAGYSLRLGPGLRIDVEGGPAFRHSVSQNHSNGSSIGGRASADMVWKIAPTLEVQQNASFFFQEGTRTGRSTTSVDSVLLEAFRIRVSYEVRYEQNLARSIERWDSSSRASLVYSF